MSAHRYPERPVRFRIQRFLHVYGWRAYALPVLSVVTVAALTHMGSGPAARQQLATRTQRTPATPSAATVNQSPRRSAAAWRPAGTTPAVQRLTLPADHVSSCVQNSYRQLILVSVTQQHLWVCQGHRQINDTPVTTGRTVNGDQTPVGSWRVQAKQRDRYLVGRGYRDYVKYWLPYDGDFGLHDASWQTMPFGSPDYHTRGSHGCVHVPTPTMAWLYHWATVGGTVVTVES